MRKNLLKNFKIPTDIQYEIDTEEANYGKFIIAPFERGFGITMGNSLRRILLSSIQGYAVTAIRVSIFGEDESKYFLSSEYDVIKGVQEDTYEFIHALKQLNFHLNNDLTEKLCVIRKSGPSILTAADLQIDSTIVVDKPHMHLLTIVEDVDIEIELDIKLGRGYIPAELNSKYIEVIGTIPIDAIFSPIEKVKYKTENIRVGNRADYDKLILEVWTNGIISPTDAIAEAAKLAKDYFSVFINFNEQELITDAMYDEEMHRIEELLKTPVSELELSVRASNCLRNANIVSLGDLISKTEDSIAKTRNFGKKSLNEIKDRLSEWDLSLGMTDTSVLKGSKKLSGISKLIKKEDTNET